QTCRFDFDVEIVNIERILLHLKARQYLQDHQGNDALTIWRTLDDGATAILCADRGDVLSCSCGEVFHRMKTAPALQKTHHVLGNAASIECIRPLASDEFERGCEFGLMLDSSCLRRAVVDEKSPPSAWISPQEFLLMPRICGDARSYRISFTRQCHGRRQHFG